MTTPRAARARWAAAHPDAPPVNGRPAPARLLADPAVMRRALEAGIREVTAEAFVATVLRTVGVGLCDDAGRPRDDVPAPASPPVLDAFVAGIPRPQGSKVPGITEGGALYVREQGATFHRNWRHALWTNLRKAWGYRPAIPDACAWSLTFVMPLPKGSPRKAGQPHTTTPDLDKLIRAVGDAAKDAGIVTDDSVLCQLREPTLKRYARRGEETGVYVRVWVLD